MKARVYQWNGRRNVQSWECSDDILHFMQVIETHLLEKIQNAFEDFVGETGMSFPEALLLSEEIVNSLRFQFLGTVLSDCMSQQPRKGRRVEEKHDSVAHESDQGDLVQGEVESNTNPDGSERGIHEQVDTDELAGTSVRSTSLSANHDGDSGESVRQEVEVGEPTNDVHSEPPIQV